MKNSTRLALAAAVLALAAGNSRAEAPGASSEKLRYDCGPTETGLQDALGGDAARITLSVNKTIPARQGGAPLYVASDQVFSGADDIRLDDSEAGTLTVSGGSAPGEYALRPYLEPVFADRRVVGSRVYFLHEDARFRFIFAPAERPAGRSEGNLVRVIASGRGNSYASCQPASAKTP